MKFELPKLPYDKNSLSPYISSETLDYHHWKHHKWYVDKLNSLIVWTEFENMTLEEIIKKSKKWPIFNNAAQTWNHTFYFNGLTGEYKEPSYLLKSMIEESFWSFDKFKEEFINSAVNNFWSGWTWLVLNSDWKLQIINTSNAETPLTDENLKALLACDVWEHAYYIDSRNSRPEYLDNFFKVINWEFVESNLWK